MSPHQEETLALLDGAGDREYDAKFRALWPRAVAWTEPYYDAYHLHATVTWLVRLDPSVSEPLLVAALTHDMERHFEGGTQPNKSEGLWDDVEYNTRHARRSADIVSAWLRDQGVSEPFVQEVIPVILQHEFGGSPSGNLMQAADSLSFLDVNVSLVARWVTSGETSLPLALRKLEWMYERIQLDEARELAQPLYQDAVNMVTREAEGATASP